MEEGLRDWYLSTLGIVQYRPWSPPVLTGRSISEDAAGSDRVQADHVAEQEPSSDPSAADPPTKITPSPQSLRELLGEQSNKNAQKPSGVFTEAKVQGGETPAPIPAEQVSFRLACWRVSDDLMVIDSWPQTEPVDAGAHTLLLSNILRSIQRLPESLPQPEFIDWPAAGEGGWSAAQEHLGMFLGGRYQLQPFNWVLLMGDEAHLGVAGGQLTIETSAVRVPLDCGGEAICTHSLSDMLARPACKKEVWANIQFLCQPDSPAIKK